MPQPNTAEFNQQQFNDGGQINPVSATTGQVSTFIGFWSVGVGGGVM